jgi:hypothetical protein
MVYDVFAQELINQFSLMLSDDCTMALNAVDIDPFKFSKNFPDQYFSIPEFFQTTFSKLTFS